MQTNSFFFFILVFLNPPGQGRVRFEVTLRLGNATIMMTSDNEDGKKKLNPHFTALLEKYVSIVLLSAHFRFYRDCLLFLLILLDLFFCLILKNKIDFSAETARSLWLKKARTLAIHFRL